MKVGTKSLLFGVHQIFWHPVTVAKAWRALYGKWPRGWEWVAILVHDWGYWGSPEMDGPVGKEHPLRSARIFSRIFWTFHRDTFPNTIKHIILRGLVAHHSRSLCTAMGVEPSALCWADKLSSVHDPVWWYLLRARVTGEIKEYRHNSRGIIPPGMSDKCWFYFLRWSMVRAVRKEIPRE